LPARLFAVFLLLTTAGCPKPRCEAGFIGDPALEPEGVLLYTNGADKQLHELAPNGTLPLMPPPQGGYVVYVAAKVKNLDACGIEFAGRFRDPTTGNEQGFDARSTTLLRKDDGYGWPNIDDNSNFSNVNPCPDYGPRDVHGQRWKFELTATDRGGRRLRLTADTLLTCQHMDPTLQADCICTCSANYFLGKCNFNPDL